MRRTTRFRQLLAGPGTAYLAEAHDGLSARIVEEAGFPGIWASGLCMAASLGVRDSNEASWTQVLEVLEFMSDASSVPVLVDADTGYGNFNNVRRLVTKLEQRGIAAMCIEDKLFPKTNSFLHGERQPLADVREFCGKITAAKETQRDPDFCVVARIEALIAGRGLTEALARAAAYHDAGADALLVHSKAATAHEVLAFMERWDRSCPVVVVPTTYVDTPTHVLEDAGVRVVIWANHLTRASIVAMQGAAAQLYRERTAAGLEPRIAPVAEVFRLQDTAELEAAEARYLPSSALAGAEG